MKECPFCGHYRWAVLVVSLDSYSVMCRECGARGLEAMLQDTAIEMWNARPEPNTAWIKTPTIINK